MIYMKYSLDNLQLPGKMDVSNFAFIGKQHPPKHVEWCGVTIC
jgi:hypothetical protein